MSTGPRCLFFSASATGAGKPGEREPAPHGDLLQRVARRHRDVRRCRLVRHAPDHSGTPRVEIGRHTSELQSRQYLVCRLLLEKKKHTPHVADPQIQETGTSGAPEWND